MDKMKKIASSAIFLSGLALILAVLSAVITPYGEVYNIIDVEKKTSYFSKEAKNTIDVIILGDSETYSAFNPLQIYKEQGITSYVCGTHAQRLCDTLSILETTLDVRTELFRGGAQCHHITGRAELACHLVSLGALMEKLGFYVA